MDAIDSEAWQLAHKQEMRAEEDAEANGWLTGYPERFFDDEASRSKKSTVTCPCGETKLLVCWIDAPYSGGYCKVTCPTCGASHVLLADYA